MDAFRERLAKHTLVGLNTCVFIYHFEDHPSYRHLTQMLLDGIQIGRQRAVTSVITIMELTVRPWQLERPSVARQYEALLVHFPNLDLAQITRDNTRRAALIRARYMVRPADALQVATALNHGATAFVTNDRGLERLAPELDLIVLDDCIAPSIA